MGWQAFPDEVTNTKIRTEMLDETIDILDLLYLRKPFDYDGRHYHLKLTELDPMYYPPKPVQQPRIPLWVPGIWPRMKSMRRILKCDGVLLQKMNSKGEFEQVTPNDLRQIKAYIEANRTLTTPFDYVAEGKMALGFALIAYPAKYGASGIMSFIVNQEGVIYEKDLGENTGTVAVAITTFDPDSTWRNYKEAAEP